MNTAAKDRKETGSGQVLGIQQSNRVNFKLSVACSERCGFLSSVMVCCVEVFFFLTGDSGAQGAFAQWVQHLTASRSL